MFTDLKLFLSAFKDYRAFQALPQDKRKIVFYAEDNASYVHFQPVIEQLTNACRQQICYLTSSPNDPIFLAKSDHILAFYIGNASVRTWLFLNLKADVMIMTMPDLESFHLKRSKVYPVHYIYIFHSMFSVHSYLYKGAVDHYDSVFCVGPHHVKEIRETERVYNLPAKHLVEFGYCRLDTLMEENKGLRQDFKMDAQDNKRILIAPSFGPHNLLVTCGQELVRGLLKAGYHVTVRPHPVTTDKSPETINALRNEFSVDKNFVLETEIRSYESLHAAHCMISDWSGVSLEFAFALERPVLFIDVPKKEKNPDAGDILCEPIEIAIRKEIGDVVAPDKVEDVPQKVRELVDNIGTIRLRIQKTRQETVFNICSSGIVGAQAIIRIAQEKKHEDVIQQHVTMSKTP